MMGPMEAEKQSPVNTPAEDCRSVLDIAADLVTGHRSVAYGKPLENHGRTAALWSAYLGVHITAQDVCALNILQKLSRERNCPKRDNRIDVAGYAENMDECHNPTR